MVLVGALLLPARLTRTDLGSFAAVPVELVLGGALLLVLPARARRPAAAVLGLALGALTVLKIVDVGFYGALARPFDLVLDWTLLPGAWELLDSSLGGTVAALVVVAAGLVVLAVLAATTWACLRLARLLDAHPGAAVPALATLTALWITCAATGVRAVPPYPVASTSSTSKVIGEIEAVREGLVDRDRFAAELAQDRFRTVPADRLLTGLRGKQVLVIFVESYGRVALTDPDIAPAVTAAAGGRHPPARLGGLAVPERLPHLPDRRRRQLAGPRHPAVRPLDRQPAALSQPGGQRPAHPDPSVRRRRLAHARR